MNNTEFTSEQVSIITGSLLGDGCVTKLKYGNCAFHKCQCPDHLEYLQWHKSIFEDKATEIKTYNNFCAGKCYIRNIIRLRSHPYFTYLRNKWYPDGKKIVPKDLVLDPLSIAIWFFDDGSNAVSKRQCKFATYCFCKNDCEILIKQLLLFGIRCYISTHNVIQIYTDSYKNFVDLVKPYMLWSCFEHKIAYRDSKHRNIHKNEVELIVDWFKSGRTMTWIAHELDKNIATISYLLRGHREKFVGLATPGMPLNNTSGIKGVCWDKTRNKWMASCKIKGNRFNLGRFASKEEASSALSSFKLSH